MLRLRGLVAQRQSMFSLPYSHPFSDVEFAQPTKGELSVHEAVEIVETKYDLGKY
jgi:hypothetical protein